MCLYTCSAVLGVKKGGPCVSAPVSVCPVCVSSCPAVCALMVVLLQVLQALLTAGALTAAALIRDSEAATGQRGRVQDNNWRFDSLSGRSSTILFSLGSTIYYSISRCVNTVYPVFGLRLGMRRPGCVSITEDSIRSVIRVCADIHWNRFSQSCSSFWKDFKDPWNTAQPIKIKCSKQFSNILDYLIGF